MPGSVRIGASVVPATIGAGSTAIGVVLIADAFGHHVPKGYIYSAMAFSVMVEMLNLRMRSRAAARVEPVKLHEPYVREGSKK